MDAKQLQETPSWKVMSEQLQKMGVDPLFADAAAIELYMTYSPHEQASAVHAAAVQASEK